MSQIDQAARLKAEKKARKEAKRQKKAAAVAVNGGAATLEASEPTEPEVAADEALKAAKKDKKDKKKRKRESEEAANAAAAPATDGDHIEVAVANDEEPAAAQEKTKKKRKKNVKGAFGNDLKRAANGQTQSSAASALATNGHAETSSNAIPSISPKEVEAFQASSGLTYDPPSAPSEFAPILAFDQLPVSQGIKNGLKSFSKPTTVQSASWGVQLRTSKTARARDCVSIAATG